MDIVAEVARFGGGYVPAFVLTWFVESIVYLATFGALGLLAVGPDRRRAYSPRWGFGRALLLTFAVNLATHPLLWWFVSTVPGLGPLVLAECLAVVIEGTILGLALRRPLVDANSWTWAYLSALLANAISLLVGLMVFPALLRVLDAAGSSVCC